MNAHHIPVVTVSYNTPDLLRGLLTSLRRFYPNPVFVIDGSDAAQQPQMATVVAAFDGVQLCSMGFNIHHGPGMAWAVQNLGLSGPVLFLDTDIVVLRNGFLESLLTELRDGDYGAGGVAAVNADGFDIPYAYGAVPYLHPPCMLCNVDVMREWPLPIKHGAPLIEAMKALQRAGQSGLLRHKDWAANDVLMGTRKVYVDHIGKGTSTATGSYNLDEWQAEVAAKLQAQSVAPSAAHSIGQPSRESHAGACNPDLLAWLPVRAQRVLEVGCSTGQLARAFKAINPGCDYRGIEIDATAAALARSVCEQVSVLDIETLPERDMAVFRDRDVWVFGDVLEHLRDPWRLLARIRKILPADGCVVACVPNAQHWSVQAQLAVGNFNYSDGGLMDRTHLRWFTRLTLLRMFRDAGFKLDGGVSRIFNEPQCESERESQRERVLPAIRAMAVCQGLDPEQAVQDALALQYVVRMVPV